MRRNGWFFVAVGLLAAGCAGVAVRPEPPRVQIVDLGLVDTTLFAQRYRLRLRVQNPNPEPLRVTGMAYELVLNGQPFLNGVDAGDVTVPAYGTEDVEVVADGTLAGWFRQFTTLERRRPQALTYELRGHVSAPGAVRLPFRSEGRVALVPEDLEESP